MNDDAIHLFIDTKCNSVMDDGYNCGKDGVRAYVRVDMRAGQAIVVAACESHAGCVDEMEDGLERQLK